ncbi:uncharacterized protein LOC135397503 [Ornithodoros turicata]|uniref:uncharacterized protein LOC135397503 n=1 Tax=Ornithodoros turicata TaxID=34597 RepID=UPI003138C851
MHRRATRCERSPPSSFPSCRQAGGPWKPPAMLVLRLSVILVFAASLCCGNERLNSKLKLAQLMKNISWQHDIGLSNTLRKSVLDILEQQPEPGQRMMAFRAIGEPEGFRSLGSRSQRTRLERRSLDTPGSRSAVDVRTMKFERGRPHIYEKRTQKGVELSCSVGYQAQVSIFWTLNGRPLEDYDLLSEETVPEGRVSNLVIKNLARLPTSTGVYTFNCTTLTDYDLSTVHLDVNIPLSDMCKDADCSERMAVCRDMSCACEGYYKVRLTSKHVTCRDESYLETPCMYNEQCLSTTKHSECTSKGWCACVKGYGRTDHNKCVPKVGVRSRCNSEDECADYDATCILNHCTCFSHKRELGDRCVSISSLSTSMEGYKFSAGDRSAPPTVSLVLVLWGLRLI